MANFIESKVTNNRGEVVTVVTVNDRLHSQDAGVLELVLHAILANATGAPNVVINLMGGDHFPANVSRPILSAAGEITSRQGTLRIVTGRRIERTLETLGLDNFIQLFDDYQKALDS